MITQKRLKEVLRYNSKTGLFTWKVDRNGRHFKGKIAGNRSPDGRVQITVDGRNYRAHRLAWFYMLDRWPKLIDHIDHDQANNAIRNLREVTQSVNMQNLVTAKVNSLTGILGVTFDRKNRKYKAQIGIDGKTKSLGRFKTADEASGAYLKAKRALHEGCTL